MLLFFIIYRSIIYPCWTSLHFTKTEVPVMYRVSTQQINIFIITGRLITIGTGNEYKFGSTGTVVYNAARYAVAGASCSLDHEMSVHGVRAITIHTESISSEKLFVLPKIPRYILLPLSPLYHQISKIPANYLLLSPTSILQYLFANIKKRN